VTNLKSNLKSLIFIVKSTQFVMAAQRSRCGHYILPCGFYLSFFFFFFPRLISAVADWMSTILLHMVWP